VPVQQLLQKEGTDECDVTLSDIDGNKLSSLADIDWQYAVISC
jgi:hypothetical protein